MYDHPLFLLFIVSSLLNIGLAMYGWWHRRLVGAAAFSLAMLLFAILPLTQAVNEISSDLAIKVIALKSRVDIAGIGATLWLIMMLQLSGYSQFVNRHILMALSIMPITILILNWTENPLFRSDYYLDSVGSSIILRWSSGPLFWFGLAYINIVLLMPLYLLWRSYRHISPLSLQQTFALSFAATLPIVLNLLIQLNIVSIPGINFPFAAGPLMGIIVAWAIFRYHVFDVVPIARGLLIESMSDGVVVLDTQNRIVDINPAMQQLIGPVTIGQSAELAFAAWPDLAARFRDITETRTEVTVDENPPLYFDLRISSLFEGGRQLTGHLIVIRDITKFKQTEMALRASENNFRQMLESAPDAMLIVDQAGNVTLSNAQAEKIFGYSQNELLGQPVELLLPERFHEIHQTHRTDYYHNPQTRPMGVGINWELAARRKDGSEFPVEISLSPLETESGLSATAAVRDITERKLIETQLQLQAAALKAAANAIAITDRDGVIEWINPAFTHLTGYTYTESLGQTMNLLRSNKHSDAFYKNLWNTIQAGLVWEDEIINRRKDGFEYFEHQTITPIHDKNGEIGHFISVKQDITARRNMEEALRNQNNYLMALHEITLGLINRHDPDALLEAVLFHLGDLMKTRHAFVEIIDPTENVLIVKVAIGNYVSQLGFRTARGEGLTGQVWETGEMLIIPDYTVWPGQLPEFHWLRTVAGIPLKVEGEVIGVIGISFDETGRAFTSEEIDLLQRFADLTSMALDNAHLISGATRQSQELSLLHEVRNAIASEIDLTSIVKRTVEAIAETFGYTLVSLYLREGDMLILQHQVGYENVISSIPISAGISGQVIRTGKPIFLEDAHSDPSFLEAIEGIVSEVVVPIFDEGHAVGILSIESRYGVKLTKADLDLMVALSDQISVAIGRARLYNSLQRNNERLSVLHEISLDILNQHEIDDLLQTITDQSVKLQDAVVGYIALKEGDELVDRAITPRDLPYRMTSAGGENDISPVWQVFESHEPFITDDFSALPNIRPETAALGVKAAIFQPILYGETCQGVLGTGRTQPNYPFDEEDINFGGLFAKLAAVALDNAQLHNTLREESIRDPLTGLFNRRFMQEALTREVLKAKRTSRPLVVVMFDLDHFKRLNDTFGHDAGDEALRRLGLLLKTTIRGSDIACRYGGEEFTLILPEASLTGALQRMEQLRQDVKALTIRHLGKSIDRLSGSFGVAIFPEHGLTGETLIKSADEALYRAKQGGRDRVVAA